MPSREDVPLVRCQSCGREAMCVTMGDGTVYRPIAWTYPDPERPLVGTCGGCQRATELAAKFGPLTGFAVVIDEG